LINPLERSHAMKRQLIGARRAGDIVANAETGEKVNQL
jgi:hypothetical protein